VGELVIRRWPSHPHLSRESRDINPPSSGQLEAGFAAFGCHSCRTLGAMAKTPESAAFHRTLGRIYDRRPRGGA
jgi:hypothetical protein